MSVTMPDVQLAEAVYREGVFVWSQKYPGIPIVSDITLTKGIFRRNSDFYKWVKKCITGGEDYRADLVMNQYHISDEWGINGTPSRVTRLLECFAKGTKATDDGTATDSEIAVQTLTLSCEQAVPELVPTP